jgi:hypothetical protein
MPGLRVLLEISNVLKLFKKIQKACHKYYYSHSKNNCKQKNPTSTPSSRVNVEGERRD